MNVSNVGVNLVKKWEGCRLMAYLDPGGIPTIGYGHTAGVKIGDKITEEKATEFLLQDLKKAEAAVNKYSGYGFNQNEYDALVSFAYNVGSINQLCKNGTRTKYQIAQHIQAYVLCNGKRLTGLVNRRKEEYNLFIKPVNDPESPYKSGASYTVIVNGLNVRTGAGTNYPKALKTTYRSGRIVKCIGTAKDAEGNTWINIGENRWICGIFRGKIYVQ